MARHSVRGRKNSKAGITLRMKVIEARIKEIKEEISLYKRYRRSLPNKRWIDHVISTLNKKLLKRKSQLRRYKLRYAKWEREGKI